MLAAKRALLAVLAERRALRQTAEAAAVPAAAAPSAAVDLKRPAAAVAAAPTAASKKAKVAPQPAAKEAGDDVAQLLEDLALRGYCVQRGVVPREVTKQAAELLQSSVAAKQSGTSEALLSNSEVPKGCLRGALEVP